MDLSPFKLDIDELLDEFTQGGSTTLGDMKRVWLSRKFSFIYEASPSTNLAFFMQSLYTHTIGHMVPTGSLPHRLGGLYCLYCLYETQLFKPRFKIYLSLEEMKQLKKLLVDAKEKGIKVASAVVKRMLEENMFLFGFVDINEGTERVNQLTHTQNTQIQFAYKKLFADTKVDHYLHMDMGSELDLKEFKKMSTEYAEAKELAIKLASEVVDVENIKHIAGNKKLMGDVMEGITEDWNAQKEGFYKKTGFCKKTDLSKCSTDEQKQIQMYQQEDGEELDDEHFDQELERLLHYNEE